VEAAVSAESFDDGVSGAAVGAASGVGEVVLDLERPHRIHLVGIGGAGMSAIATVLAARGQSLSGSDLRDSATLERLRASGIRVVVGHHRDNLEDAEIVGISSAVPDSNEEVLEARRRNIAVYRRAELLVALARGKRTVAVGGTHGKTTTSSMLALILSEAGLSPSFVIGGDLNEIGTNAAAGDGEYFVIEADESDGTFLLLAPTLAIVTNVEPDHLDHYGSFEALQAAFGRFTSSATLGCIVCADDPIASLLPAEAKLSYGFAPEATYRIGDLHCSRSAVSFTLSRSSELLGHFELPVPGALNALNAAAATVAALQLGAHLDAAQRALARFGGVARRYEFRGSRRGVTFIDDYAHLPGEVAPTLAAARSGGFSRIVCVFQPHRYSRVAALWREFADCFSDADILVVTEIYGAGEQPRPGVSGLLIADAVTSAHPVKEVIYLATREELVAYLEAVLVAGDLCLTLGAGDLTTLADEIFREDLRQPASGEERLSGEGMTQRRTRSIDGGESRRC